MVHFLGSVIPTSAARTRTIRRRINEEESDDDETEEDVDKWLEGVIQAAKVKKEELKKRAEKEKGENKPKLITLKELHERGVEITLQPSGDWETVENKKSKKKKQKKQQAEIVERSINMSLRSAMALLDSGANHAASPLQVGMISQTAPVKVADGTRKWLPVTHGETIILPKGVQSVLPVVKMAAYLGTSFQSGPDGVKFTHPKLGEIPVKVQNGLPLIAKDIFVTLLTELEQAVSAEKNGEGQVMTMEI